MWKNNSKVYFLITCACHLRLFLNVIKLPYIKFFWFWYLNWFSTCGPFLELQVLHISIRNAMPWWVTRPESCSWPRCCACPWGWWSRASAFVDRRSKRLSFSWSLSNSWLHSLRPENSSSPVQTVVVALLRRWDSIFDHTLSLCFYSCEVISMKSISIY